MTDNSSKPDPRELLAPLAKDTPPVDAAFADQLEARLRQSHSHADHRRRAAGLNRLVLGAAAALVVVAAIIGVSQFRDDTTVSLEVSEAPTEIPAAVASSDGDSSTDVAEPADQDSEPLAVASTTSTAVPTATPTTVAVTETAPTDPTTTTVPASTPEPATPAATALPAATPTPSPATAVPTTTTTEPTATPSPSATPTPLPTATPEPTAAPQPAPSAIPVPTATVEPTATPAPAPTTTPAAELELNCESLVTDQGARVQCTWSDTDQTIDSWQLLRIRNGGPRQIITTVRPAILTFRDDQVRSGDVLVYAVQGIRGDETVVTSTLARITVS